MSVIFLPQSLSTDSDRQSVDSVFRYIYCSFHLSSLSKCPSVTPNFCQLTCLQSIHLCNGLSSTLSNSLSIISYSIPFCGSFNLVTCQSDNCLFDICQFVHTFFVIEISVQYVITMFIALLSSNEPHTIMLKCVVFVLMSSLPVAAHREKSWTSRESGCKSSPSFCLARAATY